MLVQLTVCEHRRDGARLLVHDLSPEYGDTIKTKSEIFPLRSIIFISLDSPRLPVPKCFIIISTNLFVEEVESSLLNYLIWQLHGSNDQLSIIHFRVKHRVQFSFFSCYISSSEAPRGCYLFWTALVKVNSAKN